MENQPFFLMGFTVYREGLFFYSIVNLGKPKVISGDQGILACSQDGICTDGSFR